MKDKLTKESILAALSKVQEPELHQDLVTLNMIRNLEIEGEKVSFTVMLTTPACPLARTNRERSKAGSIIAWSEDGSSQIGFGCSQ